MRRTLIGLLSAFTLSMLTIAPVTGQGEEPSQGDLRSSPSLVLSARPAANSSSTTRLSRPRLPNPSSTYNHLAALSATSGTDTWSVGYYMDDTTGRPRPLILHWDGAGWSQVQSPDTGSSSEVLTAVAATSATDAWAVGYTYHNALILHWDGATWSVAESPSPNPNCNRLDGLSALSASDVWAVGSYRCANGTRTFTVHWDGTSWTRVQSPTRGVNAGLRGVSALSASDAWAVGQWDKYIGQRRTLILHWDGNRWSRFASPSPDLVNELTDVSLTRSRCAWAVGWYRNEAAQANDTLILHWDGNAWSMIESPSPSSTENLLSGVDVRGAYAWAIGSYREDTTARIKALILVKEEDLWSRVRESSVGMLPAADRRTRAAACQGTLGPRRS